MSISSRHHGQIFPHRTAKSVIIGERVYVCLGGVLLLPARLTKGNGRIWKVAVARPEVIDRSWWIREKARQHRRDPGSDRSSALTQSILAVVAALIPRSDVVGRDALGRPILILLYDPSLTGHVADDRLAKHE